MERVLRRPSSLGSFKGRERADVLRARGRAEATVYDEDVVRLGLRALACAERLF